MLIKVVDRRLVVEFLINCTKPKAVELSRPRVLLSQHWNWAPLINTSAILVRLFSPPLIPLIIALPMLVSNAASRLNLEDTFLATLHASDFLSELVTLVAAANERV